LLNKKASTLLNASTTLFVLPSLFLLMQVQLVMVDDDATPSNPLVAPVQQEELKEAPLDLNVSQRPREEEPPRRVVRTRIDRSVWDHRLSPNPHALAIYSEFVPARGTTLEGFEEC
jgi:hypothetical protein